MESEKSMEQPPQLPKPKLTLVLCSHNQERFIRDAFASLLGQTFQPLEIVAIDNGSTDQTGRIMDELAAQYSGPHSVKVVHSATRCVGGDARLLIASLSSAKWILQCDGDDKSLPGRSEALNHLLENSGEPVGAMFSNAFVMDEDGAVTAKLWHEGPYRCADTLERAVGRFDHYLLGTSMAYRADVDSILGTRLPGIWQGDRAVAFRALIFGRIVYTEEPLVCYRRYAANSWNSAWSHEFISRAPSSELLPQIHLLLEQAIIDMGTAVDKGLVASGLGRSYIAFLRLHLVKIKTWKLLEQGKRWQTLPMLVYLILRGHAPKTNSALLFVQYLPAKVSHGLWRRVDRRLSDSFWRLLARKPWMPL